MTSDQPFFEEEKLLHKLLDEELSENLDLVYDGMTKEELLKEIKLLKAEYIKIANESEEREAFIIQTPETLANTILVANIKIISEIAFSDPGLAKNTKHIIEEVREQSLFLYNSLLNK